MKISIKYLSAVILFATGLTLCISSCKHNNEEHITAKNPKILKYNATISEYQELLSGKEDSCSFYSGFVTIAPNVSGELHSTEDYEEVIIVLEGEGEVRIKNGDILRISEGNAAYISPEHFHQVFNIGDIPLKYIYVAAKSTLSDHFQLKSHHGD